MSVKTVTARCRIDAKTFRRFAYFDAFRLKKRYRKPAIFALLLLVFALLCFTALRGKPQAALIGGVLLAVGLLLPVAYFLSFALSVRAQGKKLAPGGRAKEAYALEMRAEPEGLTVSSADGKESHRIRWDHVYGAYRAAGCIYLYVHPTRAFLLPDGQASASADETFALLREQIGEKRTQDCRGGQR